MRTGNSALLSIKLQTSNFTNSPQPNQAVVDHSRSHQPTLNPSKPPKTPHTGRHPRNPRPPACILSSPIDLPTMSSPEAAAAAAAAPPPAFRTALLAGALAGTTVDLSLFPLDTLKTRLQSSAGFFPAGGFTGIYRGVGSAVVGSAPGASFFFCTYESVKHLLGRPDDATTHMLAGSAGEVAACSVRVPTEVVKQRAQAGLHGGRSILALRAILSQYGTSGFGTVWRELYRGWGITVFREVPFTMIQFPIWEALKAWGRRRPGNISRGGKDVSAVESGLYGSVAGGIAAGLTTPLDVLKTRVMLSERRVSVSQVFAQIARNEGIRPFFAGFAPRVTWISIGGAIFLGSYQSVVNFMNGAA